MATRWIEKITGSIEQKRRYRQYKTRTTRLPTSYRTAIAGIERYLMHVGAIAQGDVLVAMLEDLGDLFEQSAANESPIRQIVGQDPVEFAETFLRNYAEGQWASKERIRLVQDIEQAAAQEPGNEGRAWS